MKIILVILIAAAAPLVPAATAPAAPLPVAYTSAAADWGAPAVRPDTIYVVTMGEALISLHWTAWTSTYAKGTGEQGFNDCIPSCAAGHVTWHRAGITLSRVKHHDGTLYFSRMAAVRSNGTTIYTYNGAWS